MPKFNLLIKWKQVLLLVTILLPLCGCMQVVRQEAPYYKKGPHQTDPPDGFLEAGTHVWVFDEKNSYRRILTLDGTGGFIWQNDLLSIAAWRKQQQAEEDQNNVQ